MTKKQGMEAIELMENLTANGNLLIDTTNPKFRNKGLQKAERLVAKSLCAKCREGYYKGTASIVIDNKKIGKIITFTKSSGYYVYLDSGYSIELRCEDMPDGMDWLFWFHDSTGYIADWYYEKHGELPDKMYPWKKRGNDFFFTLAVGNELGRKELKKGEFEIIKLFVDTKLSAFVRA